VRKDGTMVLKHAAVSGNTVRKDGTMVLKYVAV